CKDFSTHEHPTKIPFYTRYENDIIYLCFNNDEFKLSTFTSSRFHLIEESEISFFAKTICERCRYLSYCAKNEYILIQNFDCQTFSCPVREEVDNRMDEIINELYDLIYKESTTKTLKDYLKKNNYNFQKVIDYCLNNQENPKALIVLAKFEKIKIKRFDYYNKAAYLNNVEGIFLTGYCYRFGVEVDKDIRQAVIYFTLSASLEHSKATYLTALSYYYGE
ncbi:956_t:CDS:2, partial [Cetraspora pellucida]